MADENKLSLIIILGVIGLCILGFAIRAVVRSLTPEPTPIRGSYRVLVDRTPLFEIPNHRAEGRIIKRFREGDYLNIPEGQSSLTCEEYSEYEKSFYTICYVEDVKTGKVGWVLRSWEKYDLNGNYIETKIYFR